jgi:cyanocobalamin reductase (cyanide-eliminating) / alkylcobalamin dealkylase
VRGELTDQLRRDCNAAGFDLVQPLQVGWYNARVSGTLQLEDYGSPANLALVIGNTRALWPEFLNALRAEPRLLAATHPLYTYTEQCISSALAGLGVRSCVRWSHAGGKGLVAMQRLAHAAGLAYLTESQLSVHAVYGPWIGLRAAVSLELPGPPGPAPELAHPCGGCEGRCRPAFDRAISAIAGPVNASSVEQSWQLWLACRDACPTGRAYRYDEAQIRYHYLKDRNQLREACLTRPGAV